MGSAAAGQARVDAQARQETQTLSLKRKRPPCSGVVQVSGGVLDYWAAALSSEYASILKIMITQSRNLANQASVATLTGQAPPGFNSERNAMLLDISTRNAVKSAEAEADAALSLTLRGERGVARGAATDPRRLRRRRRLLPPGVGRYLPPRHG